MYPERSVRVEKEKWIKLLNSYTYPRVCSGRKKFLSANSNKSVGDIWNKVYGSDASFFGDVPSNFALDCYEEFTRHGVKKILELECGQARDTIFFAFKGIDVVAIDSSQVAVDALSKITKEKNLPTKPMIHNACEGIPFNNSYFDAVYSDVVRKVINRTKIKSPE